MKFNPYKLWEDPCVVSFQAARGLDRLVAALPPGAHLLYHCMGADGAAFLRRAAAAKARRPDVHVHAMANTWADLAHHRSAGVLGGYGPVSLFTDERVFRPLDAAERAADCIYVAHFTPGDRGHCKRHYLARELRSLRIVTFVVRRDGSCSFSNFRDDFYRTFPELRHAQVNDSVVELEDVPKEFAKCGVNLALSAKEGCMLAFSEGLLCGLPAVSTRCKSARSNFFHDELVQIVDDAPEAIALGVAEMLRRAPKREQVRGFALDVLRRQREHYVEYVARLAGCSPDALSRHLFEPPGGAHRLQFELPESPSRPAARRADPARVRAGGARASGARAGGVRARPRWG